MIAADLFVINENMIGLKILACCSCLKTCLAVMGEMNDCRSSFTLRTSMCRKAAGNKVTKVSYDRKKHSDVMKRVKAKDSRPEMLVRKLLRDLGLGQYRKHFPLSVSGLHRAVEVDVYFSANGKGFRDFVRNNRPVAIQVHGCMWHGHSDCRKAYLGRGPSSHQLKIQRNVQRDASQREAIRANGIRVLTIWECALPDLRSKKFRKTKELYSLASLDRCRELKLLVTDWILSNCNIGEIGDEQVATKKVRVPSRGALA